LVTKALAAGFRAFDTANQKKHYREDYAGLALKKAFDAGLPRARLFLQSKFTSVDGQDHRLPYDPSAPIAEQVRASFEGTLKNLHTDYLDGFLLHGPASSAGMTDEDWQVWTALEQLYKEGRTKTIGVSNVGPAHLRELLESATVKPMTVQNRCYAARGWDKAVRELCRSSGVVYQGFSLLTANPQLAEDETVLAAAGRLEATQAQVVFAFAKALGILPLTGTTDERHMKEDLAALTLTLTGDELKALGAR
jgi:diketogulonate reductase-like aldo/keto reductase